MAETLRYKSFDEWYQETQRRLISILLETKKRLKLMHQGQKRKIGIARSIDDLPDKAPAAHQKAKYKLQSERLKHIKSNANLSSNARGLAQRLKKQPILDEIKVADIQRPAKMDIRNEEYKHILRRHFDLMHWEVLLRIMQVNNRADQKKNFNLVKNQMSLDYRVKYDTIFKKADYKSECDEASS